MNRPIYINKKTISHILYLLFCTFSILPPYVLIPIDDDDDDNDDDDDSKL